MENIEENIKLKFYNYSIANNFFIHKAVGFDNVYITDNQVSMFTKPYYLPCSKHGFFEPDLIDINIWTLHKTSSLLYKNFLSILNDEEKEYFIKKYFIKKYSDLFYNNSSVFDEKEFWLHFNSIDVNYCLPTQESAKKMFKTLEKRSIDTDYKIKALLNFTSCHSSFFKKGDLKINLILLLLNKVNPDYFPDFEKKLKIQIQNESKDTVNLNNNIKSYCLKKEDIFRNIKLKNDISNYSDYNSFFNLLIKHFLLSKYKKELLVNSIDTVKLTLSNNDFKIFIDSSSEQDFGVILNFLIKVFSKEFIPNNSNISSDKIEKSLDFFLLKNDLEKNRTQSVIKRKI